MSDPEDLRPLEERLADARRRLYGPEVTEADRVAVTRLEAELAAVVEPALPEEPVPTTPAEATPPPVRRGRRALTAGIGVLGLAVVVAVGAQVVMQSRVAVRDEPPVLRAAEQITLRQLLTRFSSSLPSDWQGAAIVTAREEVASAVTLPITSSVTAKHHFVVVRCPDGDGRWTVRQQVRGQGASVSGRCGALGFARLPVGVEAVRVQVGGLRPFAVAVLAHR